MVLCRKMGKFWKNLSQLKCYDISSVFIFLVTGSIHHNITELLPELHPLHLGSCFVLLFFIFSEPLKHLIDSYVCN